MRRRCDKVALVGLVIVSLWGASFLDGPEYTLSFPKMPTTSFLVAVDGWVTAHYGPIIVALAFWKSSGRSSVPWLFHILLLPSCYALLASGDRIMLSTTIVGDWDSTLGAPILPAFLVVIATIAVYYVGLVARRVQS